MQSVDVTLSAQLSCYHLMQNPKNIDFRLSIEQGSPGSSLWLEWEKAEWKWLKPELFETQM